MTQSDSPQSEDSIRVLHVDDEPNQQEFAKRFIELADPAIHLESASTPMEALERLRDESFDCIVSDYQMPEMDGIELARRIRETSDIPIIIYTGRGSEEVAEAAFTVGIDDYIRKELNPSHYQVMAKRIRVAVEKNRAEITLQGQLREMQIILDSVPALIFYKDKENRLLEFNKALVDLTGIPRDEMLGVPLSELFPDYGEAYWQDDLEVIATGEPKRGIVEPLEVPGGLRWVSTDKLPYRDEGGEITGVIGFSRDITERKQLEEASRLYLEKLEALHTHASHLSKLDDVDEISGVTSQIINDLFGVNVASVGFVEEGQLIFLSQIGRHTLSELPLDGPGITVRAVNSGLPQLVHDTEKDRDYVFGPATVHRMRSELSVPIIVDGARARVPELRLERFGRV